MGDINVGVGMATCLGAVTRSGGFKITGGTDWEEMEFPSVSVTAVAVAAVVVAAAVVE